MDANSARTANIRRLVAEAGGPVEWVRKYGGTRWVQAQVSQWINANKPKGIGTKLARELEKVMSLAHGSLDAPLTSSSQLGGLTEEKLGLAVRVAERVRDSSLEPLSAETYVAVLTQALRAVAVQDSPEDESELAKVVAAAFRSRGQGHGDKR